MALCCLLNSYALYAQSGCPAITNTNQTTVTACTGYVVDSLQVRTTANWPDKIELVRFDAPQTNPYNRGGGISLGELISSHGIATMRTIPFPLNTGKTSKTYYIYGLLKPEAADTSCRPFALVTVTIHPNPTATVIAREATCTGTVSLTDGEVHISGFAPTDMYEVANKGIFSGTRYAIPKDGVLVKDISRSGTPENYAVRVYTTNGCFIEKSVMLANIPCSCPPGQCIPVVIRKTKSHRPSR